MFINRNNGAASFMSHKIITLNIIALVAMTLIGSLPVWADEQNTSYDVNRKVFHDDLHKLEHADPLEDFKLDMESNELKFIGLRGYSIYFPGIKQSKTWIDIRNGKYDSWIVGGSSDHIMNEEHMRLISIAQKYAREYNSLMVKHFKEVYEQEHAVEFTGYDKASKEFLINLWGIENYAECEDICMKLLIRKRSFDKSLIGGATWFNPYVNGKPSLDWNSFLDTYAKISSVVEEHAWLKEVNAKSHSKVTLWINGTIPHTHTGFDVALALWSESGIPDEPYIEITLGRSHMFISMDNTKVLVTKARIIIGKGHLLEGRDFEFDPSCKIKKYMIIDKEKGIEFAAENTERDPILLNDKCSE
ncbi:MAG: hypothetical protein KAR83_06150 [Thermodesulfovibrionales bacterium]|nr:hypothetical protein [Thermodesulfovibrionales bacterium]